MTAQILYFFAIWRFYVFFKFFYFSKNLDIKKLTELEFLNLIVGSVRVQSGVTNLESKYDCSNSFGFRELAFFMIISISFFFQKNLDIKKLDTKN